MNKTILKKTAMKDVAIAISEDLGSGDVTTNILGKDKNKLSTALVKSNEDAILCGQIWFDNSFKYIQKKYGGKLKISWLKNYNRSNLFLKRVAHKAALFLCTKTLL